MNVIPHRPISRYYGGKWKIADWIISHFPPHEVYVEPYGGMASVLLKKSRSPGEVYNDLDQRIVNLFRVVRDDGENLRIALELTPFSRTEWERCRKPPDIPVSAVEDARRLLVMLQMGHGGGSHRNKGLYASVTQGKNRPMEWAKYPTALPAIINRLRGVLIENRPALDIIRQQDSRKTLFYIDPPYVADTRQNSKEYVHEMTLSDHLALSDVLNNEIEGMAIVSGYDNPSYDDFYSSWTRVEKKAWAQNNTERTEVLWLSPNIKCTQGSLPL